MKPVSVSHTNDLAISTRYQRAVTITALYQKIRWIQLARVLHIAGDEMVKWIFALFLAHGFVPAFRRVSGETIYSLE